jgi:hypothetical protein
MLSGNMEASWMAEGSPPEVLMLKWINRRMGFTRPLAHAWIQVHNFLLKIYVF